jgi:hypothetical protein
MVGILRINPKEFEFFADPFRHDMKEPQATVRQGFIDFWQASRSMCHMSNVIVWDIKTVPDLKGFAAAITLSLGWVFALGFVVAEREGIGRIGSAF